jgi:hypothetical protein
MSTEQSSRKPDNNTQIFYNILLGYKKGQKHIAYQDALGEMAANAGMILSSDLPAYKKSELLDLKYKELKQQLVSEKTIPGGIKNNIINDIDEAYNKAKIYYRNEISKELENNIENELNKVIEVYRKENPPEGMSAEDFYNKYVRALHKSAEIQLEESNNWFRELEVDRKATDVAEKIETALNGALKRLAEVKNGKDQQALTHNAENKLNQVIEQFNQQVKEAIAKGGDPAKLNSVKKEVEAERFQAVNVSDQLKIEFVEKLIKDIESRYMAKVNEISEDALLAKQVEAVKPQLEDASQKFKAAKVELENKLVKLTKLKDNLVYSNPNESQALGRFIVAVNNDIEAQSNKAINVSNLSDKITALDECTNSFTVKQPFVDVDKQIEIATTIVRENVENKIKNLEAKQVEYKNSIPDLEKQKAKLTQDIADVQNTKIPNDITALKECLKEKRASLSEDQETIKDNLSSYKGFFGWFKKLFDREGFQYLQKQSNENHAALSAVMNGEDILKNIESGLPQGKENIITNYLNNWANDLSNGVFDKFDSINQSYSQIKKYNESKKQIVDNISENSKYDPSEEIARLRSEAGIKVDSKQKQENTQQNEDINDRSNAPNLSQ